MKNLTKYIKTLDKINFVLYTIFIPIIAAIITSKWLVIRLLKIGYPLAEIWHYVIIFVITVLFTYLANVIYNKWLNLWK